MEEITYPLRSSLFVNGLEPLDEETKEKRYVGAVVFKEDGVEYETKATLRYYSYPYWARFVVWAGIVLSIMILWKVTKLVLFEK